MSRIFSNSEFKLQLTTTTVLPFTYLEYYTATGDLLSKYSESTVEIIRGFGGLLTFQGVGEKFEAWVLKHSRPLVLDFDERTIKDIFQKQKSAVILFNKENSEDLKKKLSDASGAYEGDLLFVELTVRYLVIPAWKWALRAIRRVH